jgi:homoserine O-acetyltransferase
MKLGGTLPRFHLAYETWGRLGAARDNAILLSTGLSPSSHARSHPGSPEPGWWEAFIGPGLALDTDRFFVICANVLGGCYGSTGPSSIDPRAGRPFALGFPTLTIEDMAASQRLLVASLGIEKLHAAVGSSMGGMQALAYAAEYPDEVSKLVAISASGRSYPWSIAIRFVQRQAILADPEWKGGHYTAARPPLHGLRVARELGMISYRGMGEWLPRFGRERAEPSPIPEPDRGDSAGADAEASGAPTGRESLRIAPRPGASAAHAHRFDVEFQVESYLGHAADKFVRVYDANSYLYISKAMDLFDLGEGQPSYEAGIARIRASSLIVGVPSDLLFPIDLQKDLARILRQAGRECRFELLDSPHGHDSFLIEVDPLTTILRPFL